jgi:hypothetical protein
MRGTRVWSLAGLLTCVVALAGFQQASLTLTGAVRESGTGRALAGVAVRVTEAGSVDAHIVTTDADGHYRLTGLPPARYEVSARLDGFLEGRFGQSRVGAPGRLVDLKAGSTVADIVLWRGAVITGIVYGSDGRPVTGIEVATLKRDMEFGQSRLSPAGRPVRTNDKGEYRIFGLEPGRYFVLATPPIGGAAAFGTQADSFTYAPGVTDAREATAIDARGGSDTVVNLTLQRRAVHTVSGSIDARLLPNAGSAFVEFRLLSTRAVRIVSARPNGAFEVRGLLPGRYKVSIGSTAGRTIDSPVSSAVVEVINADVTGLILGPVTRTKVLGRVRLSGGRSLTVDDMNNVRISSVPAERDTQPGLPSAAAVAPDSTFALDVWPGRFVLRLVTRRPGWVITKVTQHGRDVTAGLDAAAGADLSGIDIHVTDAAPRLRGTVTRDAATSDCAVVAFSSDSKLWRTGAGIAHVLVGADGIFSISSLAPGEYDVAAAATTDTLEDPEVLEILRPRSTRVRLSEATTSEVTVRCVALSGLPLAGQAQ